MAKLDPGIAKLLADANNSPGQRFWQVPVAEARKMAHGGNIVDNGPIPSGAVIRDTDIPGRQPSRQPGHQDPLRIRIYRPENAPKDRILPVLLYVHGGGFVINKPEDLDVLCILLCQAAGCLVASVDYRLAPEHPFPQGLEDVDSALQWAQQNAGDWGGDSKRIAIGGDSAGGNLAAVVAQLNRDRGGPALALQLLFYPNTDLNGDYPSRHEFAKGYNLEWVGMEWFIRHYMTEPKQLQDPRMSPIRAKDLSGLPPALLFTAGFDPLRDEGEAYAKNMQEAGVPVRHEHLASMIHGFVTMRGLSPKTIDKAIEVSGDELRQAFAH